MIIIGLIIGAVLGKLWHDFCFKVER